MRKRIFYGGGALVALTGAYLLARATLSSVSAQSPSPQPTAEAGADREDQEPRYTGSIRVPQDKDGRSEADERSALQGLATITPDQARASALAEFPGAAVDKVELDNENGSLVYSVHLTDASGKGWDVKVDAGNGKVLHKEADGPANSEREDRGRETESDRED